MVMFPDDLGCWIWSGFKNTAIQPKRYLGKKQIEDTYSTITGTFLMEGSKNTNDLLYWWINHANYGQEFLIASPRFFGNSGHMPVRMTNDLSITEVGDDSYQAIFNIQLISTLQEL